MGSRSRVRFVNFLIVTRNLSQAKLPGAEFSDCESRRKYIISYLERSTCVPCYFAIEHSLSNFETTSPERKCRAVTAFGDCSIFSIVYLRNKISRGILLKQSPREINGRTWFSCLFGILQLPLRENPFLPNRL